MLYAAFIAHKDLHHIEEDAQEIMTEIEHQELLHQPLMTDSEIGN